MDYNMIGTAWSLLPPIVAIALALKTKEVYSSLFIGIILGAVQYCISMGTGFDGQGIRFDTLPFRSLERGHSGIPGGSGQHRFTDEQGGWFCGFRPMGFQARKVEDWCAGSHHSARYSDIHR